MSSLSYGAFKLEPSTQEGGDDLEVILWVTLVSFKSVDGVKGGHIGH